MFGRMFLAFVLGGVVVGGVSWYLSSGPKPPVAVAATPAPVPVPSPEPVAEPEKPAVREVRAEAPRPAVKVRPVAVSRLDAAPVLLNPGPVAVAAPAAEPAPVAAPAIDLPIPLRKVDVAAPGKVVEESKPEPKREPRTATIPAGTLITVRLNETLSSDHQEEGYHFRAVLDAPVVVDGMVLAERGSIQTGKIVKVEKAGRMNTKANMTLELIELTTADGQKVEIQTDEFGRKGEGPGAKKTAVRSGIGAAAGAAIGAAAGGGIGAAIGAAAGAGAGAGSVLVTKGKPVQIASETRISFRLKEPVTLTEKL
jgi:hypothetical protein